MKIKINSNHFLLVYIGIAVFASLQAILLGPKTFEDGTIYTEFNNYLIFKNSFFNLINNLNIYDYHLDKHFDLFKYSPTFSVFFTIFSFLPDIIGLTLWNLINSLCLFFAIKYLPNIEDKKKIFIYLFNLIEALTALQNAQSNCLIGGIFLLVFILLEKNKYWLATFLIVFSGFIKVFGFLAFLLFFLYKNKKNFVLSSFTWSIFFFILPLIFIDFKQLIYLYKEWFKLLLNDHSQSYGFSVIGMLKTWFFVEITNIKLLVVIIGLILLIIPVLKTKNLNTFMFKFNFVLSIMVWVIIFNHKAESATFIIATTAISIWYFNLIKKSFIDHLLIILVFIFTVLSPTDIFPSYIRENLVAPFVLKGAFCIFTWIRMHINLLLINNK